MFKNLLNSKSFLGNVLKIASGTLLAQSLGYLFLPFITRLYTPENFGEFGIFMAMFGLISPLLGGKFEVALVLEKDKIQKMNLYLLSAIITLFISVISFLVFFFFRDIIISFFSLAINKNLLVILPFSLLLYGLYQANRFLLISNNSFGKISKTIILEKIVTIGSKLILGLFKPSSLGLIISDILAKIAAVFYTTLVIIKYRLYVSLFKYFYKDEVVKLIKKYKKFPTYELMGDWFNSISNNIPLLIMAFFFNNNIIGFYIFSNSTLKQIIALTSQNFGSVYYKKVSEISEIERKPFTLKLIKQLSVFGILPFVIIAIGAPEIFSFFFSEKWYTAGLYAQIMSPYLFLIFLLKPINSLYRVYDCQDKSLFFNIINFILSCLAVIVGGLTKNDTHTIILISISGVLIYGYRYFWILNKMKITFGEVIKIIKKHLLISIVFLLCPIIVKMTSDHVIYFLVTLVIFSIGYLLYVYKIEFHRQNLN